MSNLKTRPFMGKVRAAAALAAGAFLAAAAQAQTAVDVSASVTEIEGMKSAVLAIGAAVFVVALGVKLYKWIKSAL